MVLRISQRSSITGASPSECFESLSGHSFSYRSAVMQSVYSAVPTDWAQLSLKIQGTVNTFVLSILLTIYFLYNQIGSLIDFKH